MLKTLLIFALFSIIMSCGEEKSTVPNENTPLDSKEQLMFLDKSTQQAQLVALLDTVDSSRDNVDERIPELQARNFLKTLHPDLVNYLQPTEKIGEYDFIPLKKMRQENRNKFMESLSADKAYSGYAVTSKKVWTHIFELQNQGYEIGFLETKPKNRIAGIYSDQKRQIGLDILGAEVTLIHEARHAEQFNAIRSQRTGRISGISDQCYGHLYALFGETDANTVEMKHWLGVMDRVQFLAPWYTDRNQVLQKSDEVHYHFLTDFWNSIEYPLRKVAFIDYTNDCPQNIKDFVTKIKDRISVYSQEIKTPARMMMKGRSGNYSLWQNYYNICLFDGTSISNDFSNEECLGYKEENVNHFKKSNEQITIAYELIKKDVESRPKDLKNIYNEVPYKKEMCREMIGFNFYADCTN